MIGVVADWQVNERRRMRGKGGKERRREGRGIERSSSPVVVKEHTENCTAAPAGQCQPVAAPSLGLYAFYFSVLLLSLSVEPKQNQPLAVHTYHFKGEKREWRRELKDVQRRP